MVKPSIQHDAEEEAIVERIYEAVMDQRLSPGIKLSEAKLCEAFGVGRMRIRRSLLLLASREVVELRPNRGAYVASPSMKQAREVFEARMAIEPSIARLAAQRSTRADIASLEKHLAREAAAHDAGDRREAIRLSGQFHTLLAQMADNAVMLRMVRDLITRSSLIIGIFGGTGVVNCRDDEHAGMIQALRSGDSVRIEILMQAHLNHIKDHLDLDRRKTNAQDLVALFSSFD